MINKELDIKETIILLILATILSATIIFLSLLVSLTSGYGIYNIRGETNIFYYYIVNGLQWIFLWPFALFFKLINVLGLNSVLAYVGFLFEVMYLYLILNYLYGRFKLLYKKASFLYK